MSGRRRAARRPSTPLAAVQGLRRQRRADPGARAARSGPATRASSATSSSPARAPAGRRHQVQLPRGAGVRRHPPETSLLVLKPLAPVGAAASCHTGGVFFTNKNDATGRTCSTGRPRSARSALAPTLSDGEKFFDDYVMPIFLKRGCALEGVPLAGRAPTTSSCAPARSGFFSRFSLARQLRLRAPRVPRARRARRAAEPPRQKAGRRVAEGGFGLIHRGGPPLAVARARCIDPALCPQPWTERVDAVLHHRRVAPHRARRR